MESSLRAVDYDRHTYDGARFAAKQHRSHYPNAPLQIFRPAGDHFVFYVDDPYYVTEDKITEFNNKMRPLALAIELRANKPIDVPELNIEELLSFDHEMAFSHTLYTLENAIVLRHPDLSIIGLSQDSGTLALTVILPEESRSKDLTRLHADISQLAWKSDGVHVVFAPGNGESYSSDHDVFSIIRGRSRAKEIRSLAHVRDDDEVWYSQFEEAVLGNINPADFEFSNTGGARSVFLPSIEQNELPDLRNYFLLYDKVIMEAPLVDSENQNRNPLRHADYAEAAARGRLQLLITQPEERLSLRLLEAIQERNPRAIIGRRACAVFAMATFAERIMNFSVNDEYMKRATVAAAKSLAEICTVERGAAERMLTSPVADYHEAQNRLRHNDLKAIPSGRGDDAWAFTQAVLRNHKLPDLALEFRVANNMTSISNLFGAELALSKTRNPFAFPAHLSSFLFDIFKSSTSPGPLVSDNVENDLARSALFIHPEGPIFEFFQTRPLSQLLDIVDSRGSLVAESILSDLAALSKEARVERVIQINNILSEYAAKPSEKFVGTGMPTRYANLIVQSLGVFLPVIGAIAGYLQIADESAGFFRDVERIKRLGDDVARSRRQIEFLKLIRRVAWLQERE